MKGLFAALLAVSVASLHAQSPAPTIQWPAPAPIPYLTPLSSVQLNATVSAGDPKNVDLSGVYNVSGITSAGAPIVARGLDTGNGTFPEELLGTSIKWQGVTFNLGPGDAPDAVSSITVPLPGGTYSKLLMLGDLTNDEQPNVGTFTVNYTDGTSAVLTDQQMSDWVFPAGVPNESTVATYDFRYIDGVKDANSVSVYGYEIQLDPTKSVQSLVLPNDRNIVMLAFALMPPPVQGSFTYNPPAGTVLATGPHTLTASFAPTGGTSAPAQATVQLNVLAPSPQIAPIINWPVPAAIAYGTPLSSLQLNATASVEASAPVVVPLDAYARVKAIQEDGFAFGTGGFNNQGLAFSSKLLGASVAYAGGTYPLGQPNRPSAIESQTIPLPNESYGNLYLIGAGIGPQVDQPFIVTYTDGTKDTIIQSISDWTAPQPSFSGETLVKQTTYADTYTGTQQAGTFSLYGYQFPINSGKIPASLTLPLNPNVNIMALGLGNVATAQPISGTFTYTPAAGAVLPSGENQLSVTFNPADGTDYAQATATRQIVVNPPPYEFTMATSSLDLTTTYGGDGSVLLHLVPQGLAFGTPISFSVSGLNGYEKATFSPATIPATAGATDVTFAVTGALLHSERAASRPSAWWAGLLILPLAGLGRRFRKGVVLMALLALALVPGLSGCGSGYKTITTTPVIVTATNGIVSHSVTISVTVSAN